mmetsp:Transcript_7051/g.12738  ORF Transcript_7051/g.12738 Transcript_7051/m.12738 type:complete len:498 (+) Transcript_7051:178-1671(+)
MLERQVLHGLQLRSGQLRHVRHQILALVLDDTQRVPRRVQYLGLGRTGPRPRHVLQHVREGQFRYVLGPVAQFSGTTHQEPRPTDERQITVVGLVGLHGQQPIDRTRPSFGDAGVEGGEGSEAVGDLGDGPEGGEGDGGSYRLGQRVEVFREEGPAGVRRRRRILRPAVRIQFPQFVPASLQTDPPPYRLGAAVVREHVPFVGEGGLEHRHQGRNARLAREGEDDCPAVAHVGTDSPRVEAAKGEEGGLELGLGQVSRRGGGEGGEGGHPEWFADEGRSGAAPDRDTSQNFRAQPRRGVRDEAQGRGRYHVLELGGEDGREGHERDLDSPPLPLGRLPPVQGGQLLRRRRRGERQPQVPLPRVPFVLGILIDRHDDGRFLRLVQQFRGQRFVLGVLRQQFRVAAFLVRVVPPRRAPRGLLPLLRRRIVSPVVLPVTRSAARAANVDVALHVRPHRRRLSVERLLERVLLLGPALGAEPIGTQEESRDRVHLEEGYRG